MEGQPRTWRRAGSLKVVMIVLGVIFVALVLICGGWLTAVYFGGKPLQTEVFREIANAPLKSTRLSSEQRSRIKAIVARVVNGAEENRISVVQLDDIIAELSRGPYSDLATIELARSSIAGLLEQDASRWEQASLVIDRFARGVYEGRISRERASRALDYVSDLNAQGRRVMKQPVTEEQAENFLETALKEADRAGIPDEPYQVDLAGVLEAAINKVLGGSPASAPSSGPAAITSLPATERGGASSEPRR